MVLGEKLFFLEHLGSIELQFCKCREIREEKLQNMGMGKRRLLKCVDYPRDLMCFQCKNLELFGNTHFSKILGSVLYRSVSNILRWAEAENWETHLKMGSLPILFLWYCSYVCWPIQRSEWVLIPLMAFSFRSGGPTAPCSSGPNSKSQEDNVFWGSCFLVFFLFLYALGRIIWSSQLLLLNILRLIMKSILS